MKDCGNWLMNCLDCSRPQGMHFQNQSIEQLVTFGDEIVIRGHTRRPISEYKRANVPKKNSEFRIKLYKCSPVNEHNTDYDSFRPR